MNNMKYNITVTYLVNPDKVAWIYTHVEDEYQIPVPFSSTVPYELVTQDIVSSSFDASARESEVRGLESLVRTSLQEALDEKYEADTVVVKKVVIATASGSDKVSDKVRQILGAGG